MFGILKKLLRFNIGENICYVVSISAQCFNLIGPCAMLHAAIVIFAVARGVFSFVQTFMAQTLSQNVAFDFRNELFAKIQRLSFSYHDRNRTGQLMIRATDDVERVRLFIG